MCRSSTEQPTLITQTNGDNNARTTLLFVSLASRKQPLFGRKETRARTVHALVLGVTRHARRGKHQLPHLNTFSYTCTSKKTI